MNSPFFVPLNRYFCTLLIVVAGLGNANAIEFVDIRSSDELLYFGSQRNVNKPIVDSADLLVKVVAARHGVVNDATASGSAVTNTISNNNTFKKIAGSKEKRGIKHFRYQQMFNGLPVWGEQILVHSKNKKPFYLSGRIARGLFQDLSGVDITNVLDEPEVLTIAKQWLVDKTQITLDKWRFASLSVQKIIFNHRGVAKVAYHTNYFAEPVYNNSTSGVLTEAKPSRPNFIIDAATGQILKYWEGLTQAEATGPGGNERTGRYEYGIDYTPLAVTQEGNDCIMENSRVKTINFDTVATDFGDVIPQDLPAFRFPCSENTYKAVNGAFSPLNDAHYFGGVVYDMFQEWFGIAPLDFKMKLRVHFGDQYENAFWDGETMTFGDGGDNLYPLVDVNIVAHEAAHGFTEQNSGLLYFQQSGGVNEAFSDIVGEATEYYLRGSVDWFSAQDIVKSGDAFRFFITPSDDGDSIGHADDYVLGMDVHHSSGVFNRAYYLLSTSADWNPKKALELFVLANQSYWSPFSDFYDAACGVMLSALELDYDWRAVNSAFSTVGVPCLDLPIDEDADGMGDVWEEYYGFDSTDATDAEKDEDGDGLKNVEEFDLKTNPTLTDTDGDTLSDNDEVILFNTNPLLSDSDDDGMPDNWEIQYNLAPNDDGDANGDIDGDGFSNLVEYILDTEPNNKISTPENLRIFTESFESELSKSWSNPFDNSDGWEISDIFSSHGERSLVASSFYGSTSIIEWIGMFPEGELQFDINVTGGQFLLEIDGGEPIASQGDGDTKRLYIDVAEGLHRLRFVFYSGWDFSVILPSIWIDRMQFVEQGDFDNDGMTNGWEVEYLLDPDNPLDASRDLDNDRLLNVEEFEHKTRPNVSDSDYDGLSDYDEVYNIESNPLLSDTDTDRLPDGWEHAYGLQVMVNDAADDLDKDGFSNIDEYHLGSKPNDSGSLPTNITFYSQTFENIESNGDIPSGWLSETNASTWRYATHPTIAGTKVLRNSVEGLGGTSSIEFFRKFEQGILSFEWIGERLTEDDRFTVFVDDEEIFQFEDTFFWERRSIQISEGEHRIRWQFSQNEGISFESRSVFIDNILFFVPELDQDNDGLTNEQEYTEYGTALDNADTDGDGLNDAEELSLGTDPLVSDSDKDGVADGDDAYPNDSSRHAAPSDGGGSGGGGGGSSTLGFLAIIALTVNARRKYLLKNRNISANSELMANMPL